MKTHRFDPLSFSAGLAFTVLGIAAASGELADLNRLRVGWPLLLVFFGVMLVGSTVNRRPEAVPSEADGERALDGDG